MTARHPLLALLVIAATALPARADRRADAGKAFAAGQAADQRGEYDEAVGDYLKAYGVGEYHGAFAFDILSRYPIGKQRLKPVIGVGYGYAGGPGYELIAGLHFDLRMHGDTRFAVVAESGFRVGGVKPVMTGADPSSDVATVPRAFVPVMLTVEVAR